MFHTKEGIKLIEESPSPLVDVATRKKLAVPLSMTKSVNYVGVGTIEFLMDADKLCLYGNEYRIQVEHPVTEMVTGIDLIKQQIKMHTLGKSVPF